MAQHTGRGPIRWVVTYLTCSVMCVCGGGGGGGWLVKAMHTVVHCAEQDTYAMTWIVSIRRELVD